MSTRRRTLSNNRRSGLPLHEPYDVHDHSPNSSFGSHFGEGGTGGGGGGTSHHGTDRQSLAHELVSALEGDAGNETMGMSLAEEFGIYEEDDDSSQQVSSSAVYAVEPIFGQPSDFEEGAMFGGSTSFETEQDPHELDPELDPYALGVDQDGYPTSADGYGYASADDMVPTKSNTRCRTTTASSSHRREPHSPSLSLRSRQVSSSSTHTFTARSSSTRSSPSTSPRATSFRRGHESSFEPAYFEDNDHDGFYSPRQQFYSPSSSPSSPSTLGSHPRESHQSQLVSSLEPSTLVPLLSLNDRSFELERKATSYLAKMDESIRERDAMERELGMLELEVKRFIGDGGGFESELETEGRSDKDEEENGLDGLPSLGRVTRTRMPSSLERVLEEDPESSFDRSFTPSASRTNGLASYSSITSSMSISAHLAPSLAELTTMTTSLAACLSSINDASQINLSSSADLGRRLRALRTTFGGWKVEEDGLDKARREIEGFEGKSKALMGGDDAASERSTEEHSRKTGRRRDIKDLVEEEMKSFTVAFEAFENETRSVRDEHASWLAREVVVR